MAELHVLETFRGTCKASVIETLEDALREAREGDVVAVAISVVRSSGAANAVFSQSDVGPALLGSVEILKGRLLNFLGEPRG